MYVYDKANELARALAESKEYKAYKTAKEKIELDAGTKKMVQDFKRKQFELQTAQITGQKLDEQKMNQIQSLYQVIIMNPDIAEYLQAEFALNQMLNDVYGILGKTVEIDMSFLKDDKTE